MWIHNFLKIFLPWIYVCISLPKIDVATIIIIDYIYGYLLLTLLLMLLAHLYNQQASGCTCVFRDKRWNWSACECLHWDKWRNLKNVVFKAVTVIDCDRIGEHFPCILYNVIPQRKIILLITMCNKNFREKNFYGLALSIKYF